MAQERDKERKKASRVESSSVAISMKPLGWPAKLRENMKYGIDSYLKQAWKEILAILS